jgi:hypothetical protein
MLRWRRRNLLEVMDSVAECDVYRIPRYNLNNRRLLGPVNMNCSAVLLLYVLLL